ncbi:MAG: hypothetical protein Q7R41_15790 [Phycisphaerales bacterium]|nr:hypothetical protein [Phycisphaerales bacterium]
MTTMIEEKMSGAMRGRTSAGTFAVGNRGGPGRPANDGVEAFRKDARGDAVREALESIAAELADAEQAIAGCDAKLAEAEAAYLESIAPMLKERIKGEVAYSRSKAAQTFLSSGDLDRADAWEVAGRRYAEAVAALAAADAELARCPCPSGDRRTLILDRDAWTRVQEHDRAMESQQAAEQELNEAEIQCRSLGVPVDVAPSQEGAHEGSRRRPSRASEMRNL